jgi:hypothetical protein
LRPDTGAMPAASSFLAGFGLSLSLVATIGA